MILDPSGRLLWFKPLPRYTSATNLRVQEYAGQPVLTWWQGDISIHGFGTGEDVIYSSAYAEIAQRARRQRPPRRPARLPPHRARARRS